MGQAVAGSSRSTFKPFTLPEWKPQDEKPLWSDLDINQEANKSGNAIAVGADDALRAMDARLAGTGATGAMAGAAQDIYENAGQQQASNRADVQRGARIDNAQFRLQQLDQALRRRDQDIQGLGEIGRQTLTGRGQDIERENEQGRQGLTRQGQELDFAGESGRQTNQRYIADLDAALRKQGFSEEWRKALLGARVEGRGQDVSQRRDELDYLMGNRRIDADQRAGDRDAGVTQRGQDTGYNQAFLSALANALGLSSGQRGDDVRYQSSLNELMSSDAWRRLQLEMERERLRQGSMNLAYGDRAIN